jgi:hypothetical protein
MGQIITGAWRKDEEIEASLNQLVALRPVSYEDLRNLDASQVVDMFNRILETLVELYEETQSNFSAIETLSKEIRSLKHQAGKAPDIAKLKEDSKKRALGLRTRLGLENPPSGGFEKIRGLIKQYSNENEDSVEFLRRQEKTNADLS